MATFDDVKAAFWGDGTYGILRPLTSAMVTEAETILDITLPAGLIDLLRIQNGGSVADAWSIFPTREPTSWAEDHVAFDMLSGIGPAGHESIMDTPYLAEEWGLPAPVVLLCGDGHYWIALDYRRSGPHGEPQVTWLDTEVHQDIVLANSFRDFIEGLGPRCDADTDLSKQTRPHAPQRHGGFPAHGYERG